MELQQVSRFPDFIELAWERAEFKELTRIQEEAMPLLLDNKDVIMESPTGTGKTLTYLLPILRKINMEIKKTQAVILAPTRELCMQIHQVAQEWLKGSKGTSASLIGGADLKRQVDKLKKHPEIVVGTPARIQELIGMKKLKMHEVKTIVMDEADQLLVLDSFPVVEAIIRTTLADRELIMVSATVTERVQALANDWMKDPEVVRVSRQDQAGGQVLHAYMICHPKDKIDQLRQYIKAQNVKALVFINGSGYIPEVEKRLKSRGVHAGILSGEGTKTEREATIGQFRNGQIPVLLTTDLAARGLDIEDVTHVIHFDLPEELNQYIHRSGRTARQGKQGTVMSFITPRDEKKLLQFANQLKIKLEKQDAQEKPRGRRYAGGESGTGKSFKRSGGSGNKDRTKLSQKSPKEGPSGSSELSQTQRKPNSTTNKKK